MITTVAEFLKRLADEEAEKLAAHGIKHGPTIGAMYEGLTRSVLERALPPGLDLRIVDGFVLDGLGGRSGQIDGMLVRGAGTPVPYQPGSFEWHVKDVLAVFEVKKTLFGAGLADAYGQMKGVLEQYSNWIQSAKGAAPNLRAALRAYAEITGEVAPPGSAWSTMPMDRHLILHTLMADQLAPVRIIFGYGGFTSELNLRKGFLKHLTGNLGKLGFGPPTLPNLIVAGGHSLVKLSGHPYRWPLSREGRWPIIASTPRNPIHLILELIWTRLSYEHPLNELFGDDLELEGMAPLLSAQPALFPGTMDRWGWNYHVHNWSKAELAAAPPSHPWEPVELDALQHALVAQLCQDDIDMDDPAFVAAIARDGSDVETVADGLVATRLVARDGRRLVLTTTQCRCVCLPDGRFVAGDDNTGRLTRWVEAFMVDWRSSVAGTERPMPD